MREAETGLRKGLGLEKEGEGSLLGEMGERGFSDKGFTEKESMVETGSLNSPSQRALSGWFSFRFF